MVDKTIDKLLIYSPTYAWGVPPCMAHSRGSCRIPTTSKLQAGFQPDVPMAGVSRGTNNLDRCATGVPRVGE